MTVQSHCVADHRREQIAAAETLFLPSRALTSRRNELFPKASHLRILVPLLLRKDASFCCPNPARPNAHVTIFKLKGFPSDETGHSSVLPQTLKERRSTPVSVPTVPVKQVCARRVDGSVHGRNRFHNRCGHKWVSVSTDIRNWENTKSRVTHKMPRYVTHAAASGRCIMWARSPPRLRSLIRKLK